MKWGHFIVLSAYFYYTQLDDSSDNKNGNIVMFLPFNYKVPNLYSAPKFLTQNET